MNDPFVTAAWGEANHADGKVKMLADTQMEFTKVRASVLPGRQNWHCHLRGCMHLWSNSLANDTRG